MSPISGAGLTALPAEWRRLWSPEGFCFLRDLPAAMGSARESTPAGARTDVNEAVVLRYWSINQTSLP